MTAGDSIDTFLRRVAATDDAPRFSTVPRHAGRYEILHRLGRGGLGLVHAGWDPHLRREVAVKFVRPERSGGTAGAVLQSRLRREARALARLAHPNVVEVFDVGEAHGQVYLVMRKIDGVTLRQWLRARPCSVTEIVAIYGQAGTGLAAAHDVGVVHRDFKPDNVLVDPSGHAIVVDFGLAAAVGQRGTTTERPRESADDDADSVGLADASRDPNERLTQHGARLGTPTYAAPEQRAGEEATAASDQYSFCVSLREALPFGADVPQRVIDALDRGLSRDAARRWASMHELLGALSGRNRRGRRGRRLALAGSLLVGGVAIAHVAAPQDACTDLDSGWDSARRNRLRGAFVGSSVANAAEIFDRVAQRLDARDVEWYARRAEVCAAMPSAGEDANLASAALECLADRRVDLVAFVEVLADDPRTVAVLGARDYAAELPAISTCGDERWLARRAASMGRRGADLREDLARSRALWWAGRHADAASLARSVASRAEARAMPEEQANALVLAARIVGATGDYAQTERLFTSAYEVAVAGGQDEPAFHAGIGLVGLVGGIESSFEGGLRWAAIAEALMVRLEAAGTVDEAYLRMELGKLHRDAGRLEEALAQYDRASELMAAVLGADHPHVTAIQQNVGGVQYGLGRYEDAEATFLATREEAAADLGADHLQVGSVTINLGMARLRQGRLDEAERDLLDGIAIIERALGPDHVYVAKNLGNLASCYFDAARFEDAIDVQRRALAILESEYGPDHPAVAAALARLGSAYRAVERFDEAETTLTRGLVIAEGGHDPGHLVAGTILQELAALHWARGETERARSMSDRAVAMLGPDAAVVQPEPAPPP